MKEKTTKILLVTVCVLLALCLFQIGSLRRDMQNKYNNLSSNISDIRHEMVNITANVSNALEEKASIIAHKEFDLSNPDTQALTIQLNASVVPKEYDEARTNATLYVGGKAYDMTKKDGAFTLSVPVSIFDNCSVEKVVFKDGDTVRTEAIDYYMNPKSEAFATVYSDLSGSWTGSPNNEKRIYEVDMDSSLNINVEYGNSEMNVTSAELVYFRDGKLVKSEKIDLNDGDERGDSVTFSKLLDESIEIPYGSTVTLCTIVTDNIGLKHVNVAQQFIVDKSGKLKDNDNEWIWHSSEDMIYDADGNCVFNPYEEFEDEYGVQFDFEF